MGAVLLWSWKSLEALLSAKPNQANRTQQQSILYTIFFSIHLKRQKASAKSGI
jgi:hypothetical protein